MADNNKVVQKIIFGPPGVGKSYYVHNIIKKNLGIEDDKNVFTTIFHPEYRYGDFVGKLLPYCENGHITYRYFRGPFLKALAKAYKNILEYKENSKNNKETQSDKENSPNENNEISNVLLIIDEINRGNSAAIFGSIFQLLDRAENGWSQYSIMISELEWEEFLKEIGFGIYIQNNEKEYYYKENINIKGFKNRINSIIKQEAIEKIQEAIKNIENDDDQNIKEAIEKIQEAIKNIENDDDQNIQEAIKNIEKAIENIKNIEPFKEGYLKLPPNFHIVATMNTSDESIYYMDSAFKRRWDWEYLDIDGNGFKFNSKDFDWECLRSYLNNFIKTHAEYVGGNIEDKLLGRWFLKEVSYEKLINKVLFHLWDSIFSRNKEPLKELIYGNEKENKEIVTFGDFVKAFDDKFSNILSSANDYCNQNTKKNNKSHNNKQTNNNQSDNDEQTDTKQNSD